MPIRFPCPSCRERLLVRDEFGRRQVRCPACKQPVTAPATSEAGPDGFVILEEKNVVLPDMSPIVGRRRPKWPIIAVVAIVLLSAAGVSILYLVGTQSPIDSLLDEVPPADALLMITADFEPKPLRPPAGLEGIHDYAVIVRTREGPFQTLSVARGKFDVDGVAILYQQRGFVKEGELWVKEGTAASIQKNRVLEGTRDIVLEALRVQQGKARSWLDALDAPQRSVLAPVKKGDLLYYSSSTEWYGNLFIAAFRDIGRRPPPAKYGLLVGVEKTGHVTVVIGCGPGPEADVAEGTARSALFDIDDIKITRQGDLLIARGKSNPARRVIAANEKSAVAALRAIVAAQKDFFDHDRDFNDVKDFWTADVSGLYRITPVIPGQAPMAINLIDVSIAAADALPLKPSEFDNLIGPELTQDNRVKERDGYYFRVFVEDELGMPYRQDTDESGVMARHKTKFAICAYPSRYGETARMTLIVNQEGVIYRKDISVNPPTRWPGSPAVEGWQPVD